ncbi:MULTISPECIES: S-layer homology domain-containing protein [unclassified Paenibacillus]|uniref:S-layer homology domain-containing protein n=1 Tax=unclassified Paenibacillus TaxID=185978 RepID=UPI003632F12E
MTLTNSSGGSGSRSTGSGSTGTGSTESGNTGSATGGSTVPPTTKFNDVGASYSWAQFAIEDLAAKGIIKGTGNGNFEPAQNVTRADFITMIVRALGLKADFATNLEDISKTAYYYDAVGIAKTLGIVQGEDDNHFGAQSPITRQDMMVIVNRALKVTGKSLERASLGNISGYTDVSLVSDYGAAAVAELIHSGIIQGSNNEINPLGTATRAETVVVIYRLLQKQFV